VMCFFDTVPHSDLVKSEPEAPIAIRTDLGAVFVSLELNRLT
jgi:hypothetical protein